MHSLSCSSTPVLLAEGVLKGLLCSEAGDHEGRGEAKAEGRVGGKAEGMVRVGAGDEVGAAAGGALSLCLPG